MRTPIALLAAAWLASAGLFAAPQPPPPTQTVKQYCAGCHSDRGKAGGLSLAEFDATSPAMHADTAERIIRKLRLGMMPPPGAKRPDEGVLTDLRRTLETRMDARASARPNPG